ncbi:hypothetical protein QUB80_20275 [Chlorogloeopsis sp. ULAP01]|nr:hypothetical protein [Chlorogloeopsis sp. ULAP01]
MWYAKIWDKGINAAPNLILLSPVKNTLGREKIDALERLWLCWVSPRSIR